MYNTLRVYDSDVHGVKLFVYVDTLGLGIVLCLVVVESELMSKRCTGTCSRTN